MDATIRVMAAENNRDMCEVLEALVRSGPDLEWAGSAEDGLQALDMIVQVRPDVVLLDIIMPYLDGLGVLQRLAEMDLEKKPGIIVVTAFEEEGMVKRSARLGADYYVLKPFDGPGLLTRIRQVAGVDKMVPVRNRGTSIAPVQGKACDQVARILFRMGTPTYFKGYQYLKDAIEMVRSDPGQLAVITKTLYPKIAQKHGTTPLIVEAAIRYAIQKTWRSGNTDYLKRVFGQCGGTRDGKAPTNSFFIARVAEELRLGLLDGA